ncbi:hypothetical protein BJ944DRAFT_261905 [Cunninghamella echinulata]|nr:hypothetical protein BJ944DRAFT_261905 [Cunninghamella echinulata]
MDTQHNASLNGFLVSTSSFTATPTTHYVHPPINSVPTSTVGPLGIGIAIGLTVIVFMILYCGKLKRRVSYRSQPTTTAQLTQQQNMSQHTLQNDIHNNNSNINSNNNGNSNLIASSRYSTYAPSNRDSTWSSTSTLPILQPTYHHQQQHPSVPDIQINVVPPK